MKRRAFPAASSLGLLIVPCCLLFGQGAAPSPALQDAAAALQKGDFAGAELKLRAELKLHLKDAETLSLLGLAMDGQDKWSAAEPIHLQALAVAPNSTRVLGNYGNHLQLTGDQKGARAAFLKALEVDPADRYANVQLIRAALRWKDAEHVKEALSYLDHLGAAEHESPDVAVFRLTALDLTGDREGAEAVAARLTSATAKDSDLSASIGWTLAEAGEFDRAEVFLTQALASNPSNFRVLYNLGVVGIYARHWERARDVLEKAVRLEPKSVDALYSLAFVYSTLKQPEPTLRLAVQAARLSPQRADVQRLIAVTASQLNAYEDSIAAWDRYVALAPKDDAARRERGFARIHLRQFETGTADLEWYIARHPDDPVGYYELGLAQSTSDPTKGRSSLDKALELKPDFAAARSARGALNYVQGNPEAAVPDLEMATASEPANGMILDRLGQAYRALDRLADAIRVLRRAAELEPDESTIQLHLANALAEAGQNTESEALMARYRQMRPIQAPRGLMHYLSLTPEQQRADYRTRVEKAVKDNPDDASAQLHYLKLSLEENRMDQAAAIGHLIAGMRAGAAIFADAGRALLEARQYSPAKEALEKAAAADPSSSVELELAITAFHTKDAGAGLGQLERVPESRRNSDYYLARAQMLDASGKSEDASAALEQAIRISPKRTDLYWQAAALRSRAGDGRAALQLLDRAQHELPQDPQIPVVKATLLEVAGQTEEAERLLAEIQRRWPEGAALWVARGIIAAKHQRYAEARQALETAAMFGARSPEAFFYLADSTLRSAPDRIEDARAAIAKALHLAPDDPSIQVLAWRIGGGKANTSAATELPDPNRLFLTRPPQDW